MPNNQENENYNNDDLSFAVMPHSRSGNVPVPRPISDVQAPAEMPREEGTEAGAHHIWQSKTTYVIVGVLVLLTLGALAYFLLGTGKDTEEEPATDTKLPKVFMQRYFGADVCSDPGKCGDGADPDLDGLSNYDEFVEQTDPTMSDTDEDGLADGDEVHVFLTEPANKFTDERTISIQNGYTDSSQIKNNYDPLTPGMAMTGQRKLQIENAKKEYGLHEPTPTTLDSVAYQPKNVSVTIVNGKFDPGTVTIKANDTVIWLNKDSASHQISSDPHPGHALLPTLASGILATNQTYSYKFTVPGTYGFHDENNPTIKGTVVVQ